MLDKTSGTPLHAQLSALLRQQIRSGALAADTQLPSERELCETYDVSRITVRKALSEMAHEGLIYTVTGKGSYVNPPRIDEEIRPFSSFTEDMQRRGLTAMSKVLEARVVNASAEQAQKMGLPKGVELAVLRRLRMTAHDGTPIAIQQVWLPHHRCPGLLHHDLETGSLYHILKTQYNLTLAHAETGISAALAQPEECDLLKLTPPAAVLISEQTTYDENEQVIEFSRSVFRADRYTLYTRT